jgi:hypothetical protein
MKVINTIILLYLIGTVSLFINGCTVKGFMLGTEEDWKAIEKTSVEMDSLSLGKSDYVEVELLDGTKYQGTVTEIVQNNHIKLYLNKSGVYRMRKESDSNKATYFTTMTIKWSDIKSVKLIEIPIWRRIVGLSAGLIVDAGVAFVVVVVIMIINNLGIEDAPN